MRWSAMGRVVALTVVCLATAAMAGHDVVVDTALRTRITSVQFDWTPLDDILEYVQGQTKDKVIFIYSSLVLRPPQRRVTLTARLRQCTVQELIEYICFTCELSFKASRSEAGQVVVVLRRDASQDVSAALRRLIREEIRRARD